MSIEQPPAMPSVPEQLTDAEVSRLYLEVSYFEFEERLRDYYRTHKDQFEPFELTLSLNDPSFGDTDEARMNRLRNLKAMREDEVMSKIIGSIQVNGHADQRKLEPNVFASDVQFIVEE